MRSIVMHALIISQLLLISACSTPSTKPSQEIPPLVRASCPPPTAMTGMTFADFIAKVAEQGIQYRKCRAAIGLAE